MLLMTTDTALRSAHGFVHTASEPPLLLLLRPVPSQYMSPRVSNSAKVEAVVVATVVAEAAASEDADASLPTNGNE